MGTCRLELSPVGKPAWSERLFTLAASQGFVLDLHTFPPTPHLNAGISRAFSLEKPSILRSELIQASSYISVKTLYSLQMMNLLWNICWRLSMPPESFQSLSYRDTSSFLLLFFLRKREELWRHLSGHEPFFALASLSTKKKKPTLLKTPLGAMTFKDVGRIWAQCLKVSKAEKKVCDWKCEDVVQYCLRFIILHLWGY